MPPLPSELRNLLEKAVIRAREEAEQAARIALSTLAVDAERAFASLDAEQRRLRNALRAKARNSATEIKRLGLRRSSSKLPTSTGIVCSLRAFSPRTTC